MADPHDTCDLDATPFDWNSPRGRAWNSIIEGFRLGLREPGLTEVERSEIWNALLNSDGADPQDETDD